MDAAPRDRKTVVVSGVPDVLSIGRTIDKLTIHFQSRRRSRGGDVEAVRYPTNMDGVAFVTFDQAEAEQYELLADAERVTRKEQQIMTDDEFPAEYLLTVFPFTPDVSLYVSSATLDLSMFGGAQAPLIRGLRAAHRSVRFQPSLQQGKAIIEGPFSAVQALRDDLYRRAGRHKPAAAIKLKETLNPRLISHVERFSSVSGGDSKASQEPARSKLSLTPPQGTSEGAEGKSLLWYAEPQISGIPKGPSDSLGERRLCKADIREKETGAMSSFETLGSSCVITPDDMGFSQSTAEYEPKRSTEIKAEMGSSLSGPVWLPAELVSMKRPGVDTISQKHTTPHRIAAAKTRGEGGLGSRCGGADYLRESDQSGSADLQNGLPDEINTGVTGEQDPKDGSIWVDSDTFTYVRKFDGRELDRRLRGRDVSMQCVEGPDLTQILLTGKPTPTAASGVRQVSEELQSLVEGWRQRLRVHRIHLDRQDQPEQQELVRICNEVNVLFNDVLYVFEACSLKVIGPLASSFLFQKKVKDRITKLRDTFL